MENLLDPRFAGQRADMFHTAPAVDRGTLAELIGAVGLRPVWLGEDAHDLINGVLRLWLTLARSHGRHLAFRVLTDTGRV